MQSKVCQLVYKYVSMRFCSSGGVIIAGYAVAIDMTAGNIQENAKRKGLPWTIAKGFDTFLPIRYLLSIVIDHRGRVSLKTIHLS